MKIRIATRSSPLALWQTRQVAHLLTQLEPQLQIELLPITTSADRKQEIALAEIGGKALFVKELEQALLDHQADIAVHSIKDMPCELAESFQLAAILEREDPRDVFVAPHFATLADLPWGATLGTSSPRRSCQVKILRPDLKLTLLRGNVGTRVQRVMQGDYDAIILAAAGLQRLGLTTHIRSYFDPNDFIPAIGQGAIAIECLHNSSLLPWLKRLNHRPSEICVMAERMVNQELRGSCYTPLGVYAVLHGDHLTLRAMLGHLSGSVMLKAVTQGLAEAAPSLATQLVENLRAQGADRLLTLGS